MRWMRRNGNRERKRNEKRELLKAWYAQFHQLEGPADLFRRALECSIGEKIPVGKPNQRHET
jgi:hypothetical protein